MPCSLLFLLQWIKNELWADPLQYFIAADADITENGVSDSSDDDEVHHVADDSVVIVGDDTDDDGKLKMAVLQVCYFLLEQFNSSFQIVFCLFQLCQSPMFFLGNMYPIYTVFDCSVDRFKSQGDHKVL